MGPFIAVPEHQRKNLHGVFLVLGDSWICISALPATEHLVVGGHDPGKTIPRDIYGLFFCVFLLQGNLEFI